MRDMLPFLREAVGFWQLMFALKQTLYERLLFQEMLLLRVFLALSPAAFQQTIFSICCLIPVVVEKFAEL